MKKWQDRGYWISKQFYWQSLMYYFLFAARFRSLTFFSVCNPGLRFGGMLDDDKTEAYDLVHTRYLPKMIELSSGRDICDTMRQYNMSFPVIVKPNIGLKGYAVRQCRDESELRGYIDSLDSERSWLVQEYIDYPREYSIVYYRYPDTGQIGISSICRKAYPNVTGDGVSTIAELIRTLPNPFIDRSYLLDKWKSSRSTILPQGEKLILHCIGNYSRGSKFYKVDDAHPHCMATALQLAFHNVDDINFCRFDIKAKSYEAVRRGEYKIMEINGAKAEPIHIYDPHSTFVSRWRDIRHHWRTLYIIVLQQRNKNFKFPSNRAGLRSVKSIKRLVK